VSLRKKERECMREKETSPRYITPLILALLVGRNVTTQASSGNNNTSKRNLKTQSQKKFVAFNIKQQRVVFLKLSCKEGKKT
jgi:hypothetical protein